MLRRVIYRSFLFTMAATPMAMCGLLWPMPALSAQVDAADGRELVCQVRYASETRTLRQQATRDPYTAATVDFEGRFRLRAVVLGVPTRIEHVTLTVYDLASDGPPLIVHQARHKAPFNMATELPALSGWNHVYASRLGREVRYGCALQAPVQPLVQP